MKNGFLFLALALVLGCSSSNSDNTGGSSGAGGDGSGANGGTGGNDFSPDPPTVIGTEAGPESDTGTSTNWEPTSPSGFSALAPAVISGPGPEAVMRASVASSSNTGPNIDPWYVRRPKLLSDTATSPVGSSTYQGPPEEPPVMSQPSCATDEKLPGPAVVVPRQ